MLPLRLYYQRLRLYANMTVNWLHIYLRDVRFSHKSQKQQCLTAIIFMIGMFLLLKFSLSRGGSNSDPNRITFDSLRTAVVDRTGNSETRQYMMLIGVVSPDDLLLARNFYQASLLPINLKPVSVFITNSKLVYDNLIDDGIPSHLYNVSSNHKLLKTVHDVLILGSDVIVNTVKTHIFKSPVNYLLTHCKKDCDLIIQKHADEEEIFNTGYIKSNQKTINLLNNLLGLGKDDASPLEFLLAEHDAGRVNMKSLPINMFCPGQVYFQQWANDHLFGFDHKSNCLLVQSFEIANNQELEYRLKEARLWALDENGYYSDPKARYITYENTVEGKVFVEARETMALKTAMILAKITGRILILPHFHSDDIDVPISYRHPIMKISSMLKGKVRESTFMLNPKVPKFIDEEKFYNPDILPEDCEKLFHIRAGASAPFDNRIVKKLELLWPDGQKATVEECESWMEPYSECPLIRFASLYDVFDESSIEDDDLRVMWETDYKIN